MIRLTIELAYKNIKELVPYINVFFHDYSPIFKISNYLLFIYVPFYVIFAPLYPSILTFSDFIFFCSCFLLINLKSYLYSFIAYKKLNKRDIILDLETGQVVISKANRNSKRVFEINKNKTKLLNEQGLILVLNYKAVSFLSIGIPITSYSCNKESLDSIIKSIHS